MPVLSKCNKCDNYECEEFNCCLCKKNFEICELKNPFDWFSEDEDDDDILLFCSDCFRNKLNCNGCEKDYEDIKEVKYLLDKYNSLINCTLCLTENDDLDQEEMIIDKFVKSLGFKNKNELQDFVNTFMKFKDKIDLLYKFIKYENKLHLLDKLENINISDNKINIISSPEYIQLKNINEKNNIKISELETKIANLTSNIDDNTLFSQIKEQNKILVENNRKLEQDIKDIKDDYLKIQKIKNIELKLNTGIPSPSSSAENKKEKVNKLKENKNKDKILPLPNDLLEVVYYRHNNLKASYYTDEKNKNILKCCGKNYSRNELKIGKGITCTRCYRTYTLYRDDNKNKNYVKENILNEHLIDNEIEILNKIKCKNDNCNYICKKEVGLCHKCKNIQKCQIIEYELPDEKEKGYKTKLAAAGKCYFTIKYIAGIFDKAYEEGLIKSDFKELVEYVKKNKLMDEQQKNIIKNKIVRCHDIYDLYNLDKYKNIQEYIKRLEFGLNALAKLDDSSFRVFKNDIRSKLDNEYIKNQEQNGIIYCSFVSKLNSSGRVGRCTNNLEKKGKCEYHQQFCDNCKENLDGMCKCNKKCKHCNLLLKECKC